MTHRSAESSALIGLGFSTLAVALLIANALSGNRLLAVLLPAAVVCLAIGGTVSLRAHVTRSRARRAGGR